MRDGAGYVYPAAAAYARKYDRHQGVRKPPEQGHLETWMTPYSQLL
jgi:hypothetical protein